MATLDYAETLVPPESTWARLDPNTRSRLRWLFWAVTWAGLVAGCFDRRFWPWVVAFSAAHALLFWSWVEFRPWAFPAQLRMAYLGWVALGTYIPGLTPMMYVTVAGLAANLAVGYCPLARMLYLLPWNREQAFETSLLWRVFTIRPMPGRFHVPPPP